MASYQIELKKSAEKDLRRLASDVVTRVGERMKSLADDPFPVGVRKLEATEGFYRLRVGDYRVVYKVLAEERLVVVYYVRHRREAYRSL